MIYEYQHKSQLKAFNHFVVPPPPKTILINTQKTFRQSKIKVAILISFGQKRIKWNKIFVKT